MSGALNTQAPEFPEDPSIYSTGTTNADEFRDIDLLNTVGRGKTTDFSSVPNETMGKPTDGQADARAARRDYANGPEAISVANVSEQGARRYSAFTATVPVGTGGYPGEAILLLGDDRSRSRIVISNVNISDSFMVGPLDQISSGSGFLVPPNTVFESTVTESIYACTLVTGLVTLRVGVWAEYA